LEVLERERIRLTDAQSRLLLCLGDQRRANITGGAGTGKTVVAKKLVEGLALQNNRTAFICYNRALGNSFRDAISQLEGVACGSYHSFFQLLLGKEFSYYFDKAKESYGSQDEWDVVRPLAYALYLEDHGPKFDAIVIDEAQDFKPDYWLAIDLLSDDREESPYFLFSDTNQQIFSHTNSVPRLSRDFLLYTNCRNTNVIHAEAYKTYNGPDIVPPTLSGEDVFHFEKKGLNQQIEYIRKKLGSLIDEQKALPESIFILVAKSSDFESKVSALQNSSLKTKLNTSEGRQAGAIGMSTIQRFKGLESDIVFVWGIKDLAEHDIPEMRYVGCSRAKSMLFLVN
jgi:superfamily I DNA/RNA helicase